MALWVAGVQPWPRLHSWGLCGSVGLVFFVKKKKSSAQRLAAALAARTVGVDPVGLAGQYPRLFVQWQQGGLRPSAITLAFDPNAQGGRGRMFSSTQFVGPWVDEACGVREPAVNRWEQGLLYPTWRQLCMLSALTQTPLEILLSSSEGPNLLGGCGTDQLGFALRQNFHPAIVATTVQAHPEQTSLEDMTVAIKKAIASFQEQIASGTDPQSVFVEGLMGGE